MTQRMLQPEQFGMLRATDPGLGRAPIDRLADVLYAREPQFMGQLEAHARENGIQKPIGVEAHKDQLRITEGHHRAAAAYRAGVPLPLGEQIHDESDREWAARRTPDERKARDFLGEPNDPYRKLHPKRGKK